MSSSSGGDGVGGMAGGGVQKICSWRNQTTVRPGSPPRFRRGLTDPLWAECELTSPGVSLWCPRVTSDPDEVCSNRMTFTDRQLWVPSGSPK